MTLEIAQDAVDRVNEALRQGNRPIGMLGQGISAVEAAALQSMRDGTTQSRAAMNSRLLIAKERFGLEPDWGLYRAQRYQQPVPKAVLSPAPPLQAAEPGAGERVLVIGDLHQDPRHPDRLPTLVQMVLASARNIRLPPDFMPTAQKTAMEAGWLSGGYITPAGSARLLLDEEARLDEAYERNILPNLAGADLCALGKLVRGDELTTADLRQANAGALIGLVHRDRDTGWEVTRLGRRVYGLAMARAA